METFIIISAIIGITLMCIAYLIPVEGPDERKDKNRYNQTH